MKKLFFYILLLLTVFSSCKKDDNRVFDKTVDERLNEVLAAYQSQLTGAANGWKLLIQPGGGGAYGFFLKFDNNNRVQMYSDFNAPSATTIKESSYRLKALQQPGLIFDTYSYIHVLADPDPAVNGGVRGEGLRSDFEFYFQSATTDTIHLVGRFNNSKATLVRASAAEETAYNNGQLSIGLDVNNIITYYKRLTIGSQLVDLLIDSTDRSAIFSWVGSGGSYQTFVTTYSLEPDAVVFTDPVIIGSLTISSFKNISWNSGTQTLSFKVNATNATLQETILPLKFYTEAPLAWWNKARNDGSYWVSLRGFHVNGVDDAFNMRSLADLAFMLYGPDFGDSGDLLGFVVVDSSDELSLDYGLWYSSNILNTGRMFLTKTDTLATIPLAATGILANIDARLTDAAGFYFVQKDPNTYDMISASDGKAWIRWEY